MLESYFSLCARVDRFATSIRARCGEQITCRPGCTECCQAGLTLVMVEAVAIGAALGIDEERVQLQAGQAPLIDHGNCVFVNIKGLCAIYKNRPLVCRTQGLPLKYKEIEGVSVCEKNFTDQMPHASSIFDMDNLEAALFAVNVGYCRQAGLNPLARVAFDRVAALTGKFKLGKLL